MPINPCRNPQCDFFNKSLPNTAKHCPNCGKPLGYVDQGHIVSGGPDSSSSSSSSSIPALRPTLKLIHSTGSEFVLHREAGLIGRRGQSSPTIPDIDLAGIPNEGVVSRAHARVYWDASQSTYLIVDNTSRNGTLLNNMPLQPGTPYPLRQGMILQLGQDGLVRFTIDMHQEQISR